MTFRIQELVSDERSVVYSICGRIQAEHTNTLCELVKQEQRVVALDLKEVILVDRKAVRFLAYCEGRGIELKNCPAYVREWISREGT